MRLSLTRNPNGYGLTVIAATFLLNLGFVLLPETFSVNYDLVVQVLSVEFFELIMID